MNYKDNLKFVDATVTHLGENSTNAQGMTTWKAIRLKLDSGKEIFLPENKSDSKLSTFITDMLGQKVRIFYMDGASSGVNEAEILAIQFANGRSYDKVYQIDSNIAQVRKLALMALVAEVSVIVVATICTISVIGIFIGAPLFYGAWKMHKAQKLMNKVVKNYPTRQEFQQFYLDNSLEPQAKRA